MTAASNTLAAHWQLHIEAWEDSGQSHAAYCREHDLAKSRFNYWKHKLPPAPLNLPGSSFVPARVMGDTNPGLTLHLPNGASIEGICEDTLGVAQQLASTWPLGMKPILRPCRERSRVYLYRQPVEFRKSHRGLAAWISKLPGN